MRVTLQAPPPPPPTCEEQDKQSVLALKVCFVSHTNLHCHSFPPLFAVMCL